MENKIIRVNSNEIEDANYQNYLKKAYVIKLYGEEIKTFTDYLSKIEELLRFPDSCEGNVDRYLDWIRDLSWLSYDEYVFIIYDFDESFEEHLHEKNLFLSLFDNIVLPWWDFDVEKHVVGGKKKKMTLFLIE